MKKSSKKTHVFTRRPMQIWIRHEKSKKVPYTEKRVIPSKLLYYFKVNIPEHIKKRYPTKPMKEKLFKKWFLTMRSACGQMWSNDYLVGAYSVRLGQKTRMDVLVFRGTWGMGVSSYYEYFNDWIRLENQEKEEGEVVYEKYAPIFFCTRFVDPSDSFFKFRRNLLDYINDIRKGERRNFMKFIKKADLVFFMDHEETILLDDWLNAWEISYTVEDEPKIEESYSYILHNPRKSMELEEEED